MVKFYGKFSKNEKSFQWETLDGWKTTGKLTLLRLRLKKKLFKVNQSFQELNLKRQTTENKKKT